MSTLIQGVGDEVVGVLVALAVTGITYLLWLSTRVPDTPPMRPVILRPRTIPSEPVNDTETEAPSDTGGGGGSDHIDSRLQAVLSDIEETLEDVIAGNNLVEEPPEEVPEDDDPQEAELTTPTEEVAAEPSDSEVSGNSIKIRLRFLDETNFEVEAWLNETLIRFRRRCLDSRLNLGPHDKIRLIFNGRVLFRDDQVFEELGVYNECVVHCIVRRENAPDSAENVQQQNEMVQEFDLSSACYPLLGFLLFGGWGSLLIYSHYFTYASTAILVGLTLLFLTSYINSALD